MNAYYPLNTMTPDSSARKPSSPLLISENFWRALVQCLHKVNFLRAFNGSVAFTMAAAVADRAGGEGGGGQAAVSGAAGGRRSSYHQPNGPIAMSMDAHDPWAILVRRNRRLSCDVRVPTLGHARQLMLLEAKKKASRVPLESRAQNFEFNKGPVIDRLPAGSTATAPPFLLGGRLGGSGTPGGSRKGQQSTAGWSAACAPDEVAPKVIERLRVKASMPSSAVGGAFVRG
eukprot:758646-Hanusia_phi.AAC.4